MKRPTMGVSLADLTDVPSFYQQQTLKLPAEVTTGVVVTDVMNNSPASKSRSSTIRCYCRDGWSKIETTIDLRKHLYNDKNW